MGPINYQISVNMRVANGYIEIGRFFTGPDKDTVDFISEQLHGSKEISPSALLRLDIIEQHYGLDMVLESLDCTLAEMAENVKTILKETFRLFNLNPR